MTIYNDFLNRKDDVENIYNILTSAIRNDDSITIALEGEWGIGKSWILEKLERKFKGFDISNNDFTDKYRSDYFVFKYNAWENDYYDEPLVAILSSFCTQINSFDNWEIKFKQFTKSQLKKYVIKLLGLLEFSVSNISKKTLGFDVVKKGKSISKIIKEFNDSDKVNIQVEDRSIGISKDIESVVLALNKISEIKPIVFIVDELDRCIPQFTIKTLERFHHIFSKVKNSLVIVSVDAEQLNRTIQSTYGDNTPVHQYLKKFFKFNITMNHGLFNSQQFCIKMNKLLKEFNDIDYEKKELLNIVITQLFQMYTVREKVNILDKIYVFHLLNQKYKEHLNFYVLLGEITLVVIKDCIDSNKINKACLYLLTEKEPKNHLEIYLKNDLFKREPKTNWYQSFFEYDRNNYKDVIFYIVNKYYEFSMDEEHPKTAEDSIFFNSLNEYLSVFYKFCRYIKN